MELFNNLVRASDAIERARSTDPETSHIAARKYQPKANSNAARVHAMLQAMHRPPTAAELAAELGFDHVETQRRLSGLCTRGLIAKRDARKCAVKGTKMLTWEVV